MADGALVEPPPKSDVVVLVPAFPNSEGPDPEADAGAPNMDGAVVPADTVGALPKSGVEAGTGAGGIAGAGPNLKVEAAAWTGVCAAGVGARAAVDVSWVPKKLGCVFGLGASTGGASGAVAAPNENGALAGSVEVWAAATGAGPNWNPDAATFGGSTAGFASGNENEGAVEVETTGAAVTVGLKEGTGALVAGTTGGGAKNEGIALGAVEGEGVTLAEVDGVGLNSDADGTAVGWISLPNACSGKKNRQC